MEVKNYNAHFFLLLLVGISAFAFFLVKPFIIAIIIASVLAVVLHRPYHFFLKITRQSETLSALLVSLLGIIVLVVVFAFLSSLVVNEATGLYKSISNGGTNSYQASIDNIVQSAQGNHFVQSLGVYSLINRDSIGKIVSQLGSGLLAIAQGLYMSIASGIMLVFVIFFSLYYFLIGGRDLVGHLMYMSPLKNSHEKLLIEKFVSISRATIKGALVISFIQGLIGGVMFSVAGIPSAAIWAILMMVFSLVPLVGSGIVWVPAGIILLLLGNIWQGIFVLSVGFGIISVIDNFLRPKLVGKDTQMHPLVVLFATLGGISMFGFFGFIIGPIIMALFLTLWEIYGIEFKGQLKKYNA
jgi:predicted PurR-regulated permease PerM